MDEQVKKFVINLLEEYPRNLRQIAVLRYELEHPPTVSPEEIIGAMAFARGESEGRTKGTIANKTVHIAMNYQNETARLAHEATNELLSRLNPLVWEMSRLEHHLSLLSDRDQTIIRLHYFEGVSWNEISKTFQVARRTAHTMLKMAVDHLTELYEWIPQSE